jgi:hypothetical protein
VSKNKTDEKRKCGEFLMAKDGWRKNQHLWKGDTPVLLFGISSAPNISPSIFCQPSGAQEQKREKDNAVSF